MEPGDVLLFVDATRLRWFPPLRSVWARKGEQAERAITVDPSTVFDWVQKFAPLYQEAAKAHRHRVGLRWSVDETYT